MTDTTAPTIPGHECNTYCRSDEGLHCQLSHMWTLASDPVTLEHALWFANSNRGPMMFLGVAYEHVHTEHAPEAKPQTAEEACADAARNGVRWTDEPLKYICAVLEYFRVPTEVPT